jgi:hypothetical protein
MRAIGVSFFLCAGLFIFSACSAPPGLARTENAFWTVCTITLHDHASEVTLDACFARFAGDRQPHEREYSDVTSEE